MEDSVLIADDDRDIVRFVEVNLRLERFEVLTANDGEDALDKALEHRPSLIVLDVMMPKMDGYEVCKRLRADGRTERIPVIMLTAKSLSADKVVGLTAGADDYIVKPFDPMELVARVKTTLRRARELRATSPLTGLPGSGCLEQVIRQRLQLGAPIAVAAIDLDDLASYNDRYGHGRGDELLSLAAKVLKRAAFHAAGPDGLVGHVGGDDFLAVVPAEAAEPFARRAIVDFDSSVRALHDQPDATSGSVTVEAGEGGRRRVPRASVSLGIARTAEGAVADDHRKLVAMATELKHAAKQQAGSSYRLDLRSPA